MNRRHAPGLTLLEMIIVLLIASLAITLGFQSLGQWKRAEDTLARAGEGMREVRSTELWWRTSVQALVPTVVTRFQGSPTRFAGLTLSPVLAPPGGSTSIAWSLRPLGRDGTVLRLDEAGTTLDISLPDETRAQFLYAGADGKMHAQWPPALGESSDLPRSIALVRQAASGESIVWAATVSGPLDPVRDRMFEWEDE